MCYVAENIAYQYESLGFSTEELARQLIEGWKKSPEHRANMLSTAAQEIGVAVARSDKTGHWYGVQMFGRPRSAAIEFRIVNRSGIMASYAIAERTFELPPRYARTHLSCQLPTIEFQMPNKEGGPKTVQASGGDRFVLVNEGEGYAVQEEAPEEENPQ
ncbi:MAG: CAP domain-containing protein [Pirellulales bacterium]